MIKQSINILSYQHLYKFEKNQLIGGDTLRFFPLLTIMSLLERAGFTSVSVYGDWHRSKYNPLESEEMIFDVQQVSCKVAETQP